MTSWGRNNIGTRVYQRGQACEVVTADGTNHQTTVALNSSEVMLHARSQPVRIAVGANPDASTAFHFILEAGERFHTKIKDGDKISVCKDSATSTTLVVTQVQAE